MLLAKRIDLYSQVILMISAVLFAILQWFDTALLVLLITGGWQLLSTFIHFLYRQNLLRNHRRHSYEIFLIIISAAGLICLSFPQYLTAYFTLLLWSSLLMALWYGYITFIELKTWEARALIHLK